MLSSTQQNSASLPGSMATASQAVPETEPGTMEQLQGFFEKYANHQGRSSKCFLDGRYFWKVLASYPGLVESEMYIRINQSAPVRDPAVLANYNWTTLISTLRSLIVRRLVAPISRPSPCILLLMAMISQRLRKRTFDIV